MLSHPFGQEGPLLTAGAFFWLMVLFNKYAKSQCCNRIVQDVAEEVQGHASVHFLSSQIGR